MHKIEKLAITGVLTANLLVPPVANMVASDTLPQPLQSEKSPIPGAPPTVILNLSRVALAATLPPQIEEASKSTVAIVTASGSCGSGIKIGLNRILTAAHMFSQKHGGDQINTNDEQFNCASMAIEASLQLPEGSGAATAERVTYATAIEAKSAKPSVFWGTDYASLWIDADSLAARYVPSVNVGYPQYAVGKEIFFTNYEPSENSATDHQRRSPLNVDTVDSADSFREPAIYGGVVIKDTGNSLVIIDDIDRNYGKGHPETRSRGGASGGPGFVDGAYMGMMVAGPPGRMSAAQIEQVYGVRLTGSIPNMTHEGYTVGFVQKTSPDMLALGTTGGMPLPVSCSPQKLPMTINGTQLTIN
jgi:hypothetical protein